MIDSGWRVRHGNHRGIRHHVFLFFACYFFLINNQQYAHRLQCLITLGRQPKAPGLGSPRCCEPAGFTIGVLTAFPGKASKTRRTLCPSRSVQMATFLVKMRHGLRALSQPAPCLGFPGILGEAVVYTQCTKGSVIHTSEVYTDKNTLLSWCRHN
jgi:hypothetical protein